MPLFVLFWLVGESIIIYKSVKTDHVPPSPGRLLISAGPFALLALVAAGGPGPRNLATVTAFGLDLAAFMNLMSAGATGKVATFPAAGSAGSGAIIPNGGAAGAASCTSTAAATSTSGSGSGGTTATPAGSTATAIITNLAKSFGWNAAQIADWMNVLNRESGGSATAKNPTSGAYGAAQALGHGAANGSTKCPSTGENNYGGYGLSTAQAQAANCGNLADQLLWMANYIKATYGNPAGAWAHEQSAGWY